MEKIVDYKLVVGVLIMYALLIYFGGMATRKMHVSEKQIDNNYINVI